MADTTFTYGPANVTNLITLTNSHRRGEIHDGVFNDMPVLGWLKNKNKVRVAGGATILTHISKEANGTASDYDGFDLIDTTPQEEFTKFTS